MDILFLGLNYAPEPVGIGPYTAGWAEGLAARGHRVRVVAGKPYYPQWRAYDGQHGGVTHRIENDVHVTRVPHYIPARPSGARRIAHHLSFAANAARIMRAEAALGADLVVGVAPSLLSAPVALRAARRADAPFWLHVQDFEVEAALATGLLPAGKLSGYAQRLERKLIAGADVVSTISPQMRARLAEKGVAPCRIHELRNWARSDFDFARADPDRFRREWQLGDRHVALYSGNIANKQGIEILIDAARLLAHRSDIAFVICGEGPNRANLQSRAAGLGNVHLHDLQPAARMAELLSLASVHLLPQIAGAADLVLPSKLTNMLASGRATVATADPGTGLHDEVDGCGRCTPPGDAAALAAAVEALIDDPAARQALGDNARARAAERWGMDAILDAFEARAARAVAEKRAA